MSMRPPAGVYFKALPTTLSNTCRSRASSAGTGTPQPGPERQGEAGLLGGSGVGAAQLGHQAVEVDGLALQLDQPGLEPGVGEELLDELVQLLGAAPDDLHHRAHRRRHVGASSTRSAYPWITETGLRSSWLIVARNSSFIRSSSCSWAS